MSQIEALVNELLAAKVAYYTTPTPIMSDAEFDRKLRELKELDPTNPAITLIGTPVVSGQKLELKYQMVSTDKTLEVADMDRYWRRINPVLAADDLLVESLKIDGLSLNLTYLNGQLVRATTSGDGLFGTDKTEKVLMITSIPKRLETNWSGQISGEAHLTDENFMKLNEILRLEGAEEQKTSRNSTAGLLNSENLSNAKEKLALVDFKVWGVYEDNISDMYGSYDTYSEQLEMGRSLGFEPVEYHLIRKKDFDADVALTWLTEFEYECDGIVYRLNDNHKARQLGAADDYINAATALKPIPDGAMTTVVDILWEVGSKEISPVVIYEPIVLGGATCSRVSGHSIKNLIACEAYPGNQIYVTRSGGVIPKMHNRRVAENYQ